MARRSELRAELVAGHDGTDQQLINVDSSGNVAIKGGVADGAAVSGAAAPILVAGQDGTNVQTLLTDTSGALLVSPGATTQSQFNNSAAVELTRVGDTNAYSIGDFMSTDTNAANTTALVFSIARANGFSGRIIGAQMEIDSATAFAAMRLHLFNQAPFAAAGYQGDNAALALTYTALKTGAAGSNPNYIGYIDFVTFIAHSSSALSIGVCDQTELDFHCAAGSTSIYGLLEARAAFTPKNAGKYNISLDTVQG